MHAIPGINKISFKLASKRIDSLARHSGLVDMNFLESVVGIKNTFHISENQSALSLCIDAFKEMKEINKEEVDSICVVSQHTQVNVPTLSTRLHGDLGIKNKKVLCFDLSLGCTGYVQGLSTLTAIMKEYGMKSALLFNVETLSQILDPDDLNTNLIFSDAATCTLVNNQPVFCASNLGYGSNGVLWPSLSCKEQKLFMDGKVIYDFVVRNVPAELVETLGKKGLQVSEVDHFIFHQASKRTVEKLRQILKLSDKVAPFSVLDYGNTGSCSIPIILKDYLEQEKVETIVLSSFGAGLSWANMLLRRFK